MNLIKWAYARGIDIARHPKYGIHVALALLCLDGFLSYVILRKVPYTEIDWEAYMEQISQYRAGERDYRNIKGGTGPLVYPAGHVYIYNWLYIFTDGGVRRERVQVAFWVAYMATLWLAMACYRQASAPPWIMCLLVLSKRLHSIYLLRFFNDCFSTLLVFASIFLVQNRQYTLSAVFYSLSVGVKMSSLLYLPALGLIFVLSTGSPGKALRLATLMLQIQVLLAVPFVASESGSLSGYLGRAFEFSRAFLWKWTVNWRFVGEEVFTSFSFKRTGGTICSFDLGNARVCLECLSQFKIELSHGGWMYGVTVNGCGAGTQGAGSRDRRYRFQANNTPRLILLIRPGLTYLNLFPNLQNPLI
ncbi:dolichyl-P-Man:Man(5)GlcNAc(2)-PP-dolichol alpha-1,3-mannosyltransferase [Orbilia oligospora]|nr:dolichyl-P-Man:Man(5)GlcNAc(2)-PP-dolichol alpha-1,3-mannosyltransferase [Orbilia oligospora]